VGIDCVLYYAMMVLKNISKKIIALVTCCLTIYDNRKAERRIVERFLLGNSVLEFFINNVL
jgi:hypothetical protein